MVEVKICGLQREEEIGYVNQYLPNQVGFVFAQQSRRAVEPERAAALASMLSPGIRRVGVFTGEDPAAIEKIAAQVPLDIVQLHGRQREAVVHRLRQSLPSEVQIWYAIAAGADVVFPAFKADAWLLDTTVNGMFGGTGQAFPWEPVAQACKGRRVIVAGGLNPENVAQAIAAVHPAGVDVSSGVESNGRKDREKIRRFIENVRKGAR